MTSRGAGASDGLRLPVGVVQLPGNGRPWSLARGATLLADGAVRFEVWAPAAEHVTARVLTGPAAGDHPLEPGDGGVFAVTVAKVGAGADYVYVLHRGTHIVERPDPVSRFQPDGVHGPSRVVDARAFAWHDGGWRGLAMADTVLYELHVGTFTQEGTFDAVVPHLAALRDLGITTIELMPVAQFPGARNWGYDGVDPYAPQSTYGGPEGLRRLVDAAHRAGIAIALDVVYNHLGAEGNYLADYGSYFTDRYHTPWGSAVNYDDAGSDEVRRYVIENALYWITEFHVDALRLDAVHAIFDFSAWHILDELTVTVHAQAVRLGRTVTVVAESDLNDPRLLRTRERGGYAMDAQWSDDLHHAVHVALTGEHHGYYQDFRGVPDVATALRDRFVHAGTYLRHRRRRHGAPAVDVAAGRFVVFTQNHDQVGNRAGGDRLSTLVAPAELRLAAALLLLSPYVPLIFMGEEYGETNPFLYFVSHGDPALVEAVRQGRRREFAAFDWQGEVPDPQAEETFARSRLDWSRASAPEHRALRALYRDLLKLRRDEPLLRPGDAEIEVRSDPEQGWVCLARGARAGAAVSSVALFNFSREPRQVQLPAASAGGWTVRLYTDAPEYGGSGGLRAAMTGEAPSVTLGPSSAVLLGSEGSD